MPVQICMRDVLICDAMKNEIRSANHQRACRFIHTTSVQDTNELETWCRPDHLQSAEPYRVKQVRTFQLVKRSAGL